MAATRRAFAITPVPSYTIWFNSGTKYKNFEQAEKSFRGFLADWKNLIATAGDDFHVMVVGHTDAVEASVELSRARAELVKERLIDLGIHWTRLRVQAKGDKELLMQTAPGVPEPMNRRVEFYSRYSGG
jgi:outer membrane protein OmpA-like peptidoglycan-associated protein